MNCIREARIAAEVIKEQNFPFIISFVCNDQGLLSKEPLRDAVKELSKFNPMAFSINCAAPEIITKNIEELSNLTNKPLCAYGNGDGRPADKYGWEFSDNMNAEIYADYAKKWKKLGVKIIGGCCGTTPEYIKQLKKVL
jgi:homocysteine S-methyltransferase